MVVFGLGFEDSVLNFVFGFRVWRVGVGVHRASVFRICDSGLWVQGFHL